MVRPPPVVLPVPRLWPNSTIVCLGTGPSLTQDDIDFVHGEAKVIAVNDAYRVAPWAHVLYAADHYWWRLHEGVPTFRGMKYSIMPDGHQTPQREFHDVEILRNTGQDGLERDPHALRTGENSGYQAINLAVHLGASRIILLGYDLQNTGGRKHFFGDHPPSLQQHSQYATFLRHFATLPEPLAAAGVQVMNATRATALTVFPQMDLKHALHLHAVTA